MNLRVGARTDVGRVREGNEDSYMVSPPVYAVADGMGGHQGGEVASKVALETIGRRLGRDPQDPSALPGAVLDANRAVLDRASTDPTLSGMGTTLTALFAEDGVIHLAHVGDSRAYLLRGGELRQLTKDHTVVQGLVDQNRITREEAGSHPQRSILTRALGVEGELEVDATEVDVEVGDRILLCSDGLTGMVDEEVVRRILAEDEDPQSAADALVAAANDAGGQDNITAVVIDVLEGDGPDASTTPDGSPYEEPAVPVRRRGGRGWIKRTLLWIVLPLAVVALALFGVKELFIDNQWYVGNSGGRVAIYNGIPAEPMGVSLSTLVEETGIDAAQIERFSDYGGLSDGISADSREDAEAIVREMERILAEADSREPPAA